MELSEYITKQGLSVRLVSQKLKISRQAVFQYGKEHCPTAKTLEKIAKAMTELGVTTTAVDIFTAINKIKKEV